MSAKKTKKLTVTQEPGTRASEILEIVQTDILGHIHPEAVDYHSYLLGSRIIFAHVGKIFLWSQGMRLLITFNNSLRI